MNEDEIDSRLRALLAPPDEWPDEIFTRRVVGAIDAETRMAAARRRAWGRFAVESLASGAVIAAFYLLWRLAPADLPLSEFPVAPAAAAILVLLLWFGVELRPAATGR